MADPENPAPTSIALDASLARFDTDRAIYDALTTKLRERNKTALFDVLAAAGISHVAVSFDGYGDSGQIENIETKANDTVVDLPPGTITIGLAEWGRGDATSRDLSLAAAIEQLAYGFLEDTHSGWENNGGAYGDFLFDVAERSITLDYNERFESSEYTQHLF
ncbi:hypothetical protein AFEL58S_00421 [Afipia felis]|jgi:hypothetical protein